MILMNHHHKKPSFLMCPAFFFQAVLLAAELLELCELRALSGPEVGMGGIPCRKMQKKWRFGKP